MDSDNQGLSSQVRGQQNLASNSTRNNSSLFMPSGLQGSAGSIWSNNPRPDTLSRDNTTGTATTQRSSALGASETNIWSRPPASTWKSTDSQQYRSSASRSTSPPNPLQNASNTSPSYNPNRAANKSNTNFLGTYMTTTPFAQPSNSQPSYPNPSENTQGGDNRLFQQGGLMGFPRAAQGLSSTFDDVGPREFSQQSLSRHSESEAPSQSGNDTNAFSGGLGSPSRHGSRMSLGGIASFAPQQPGSRSQSQSFNPGSEHSQAAMDAVRGHLLRESLQSSSPGPRTNGTTQASTPAPSQSNGWRDFTPNAGGFNLANGILQESRRTSLANSVHHSSMNSPRAFVQRQADPWNQPTPQDFDPLGGIQRAQGQMSRQGTQSPYPNPAYNMYTDMGIQAQLMQQMQGGLNGFPVAFPNYGFQPGQQFFPPSGPAGMIPRGARLQDPSIDVRCQELEDFRRSSKSNRKWELKNVFGRVVEFAGDQQGSRFLQEKIPTANSDDRQRVFEEIMVDANALMVDVFGNYVIQQLFEHGTMVQKKLLAGKMRDHVVQLSTQLYGCRCVQEALEFTLVEQQVELAKELEPEIIRIMKSDNGNHVVQKILTKLPRDRIDFIYDAVRGRVFELSQQQYACRVIQRMIEKGTKDDKAFLLKEFHDVASRLVTDNWGNYVVQAVIRQGGLEARSQVIRLCIDQFLLFSKQKVASNVMEHCIAYGTEEDRLEMYRLITRRGDDGSSLLQVMWKDNFANYVVQKLCHCLTGAEQAALVKESRPYFESRKKPSRPDEKWLAFQKLINQFSVPPSRQGSISSGGGGVNDVLVSRPHSQSGSAMPTPDLTTGGNSPRTSSSQETSDATLENGDRYLVDQFSKASLHQVAEGQDQPLE